MALRQRALSRNVDALVIHDIPLDLRGLKEGIPPEEHLLNGAMQGLNDFKRVGYGGPCLPPGTPHRYTSCCMRWMPFSN